MFVITQLFKGTGAAFEAAGLRVGQVILQVDGVTTLGRSDGGAGHPPGGRGHNLR